LFVAVAAGLAVMSLFVGFYRLARPAGELEDRLEESLRREIVVPAGPKTGPLTRLFSQMNLEQKLGGQIALELMQADLALTVSEFVMLRLAGATVGFLVGIVLLRNFLLGVPLALLGLQMPLFYMHRRRQQRQHRFQDQLVDVISMLVSGLRAGVGLMQAMELVRKEMPAPAGEEFGRVVREVGLGVSLGEALRRLIQRMPGDDLTMLVTVINIQAEVGGNLADVLDGVVTTIRERVRIFQEIRSLTAQQRITSYALAGLPFIVGGAVMAINPGYMMPLFSPQWIWLPGIAVVMIVIGFAVISRVADIKV
jgi:tight adherence protein B